MQFKGGKDIPVQSQENIPIQSQEQIQQNQIPYNTMYNGYNGYYQNYPTMNGYYNNYNYRRFY